MIYHYSIASDITKMNLIVEKAPRQDISLMKKVIDLHFGFFYIFKTLITKVKFSIHV